MAGNMSAAIKQLNNSYAPVGIATTAFTIKIFTAYSVKLRCKIFEAHALHIY